MYWTLPTAVFFVILGVVLAGMTVWELRAPDVPRRGILPLTTTRGDRLFLGLLAMALVILGWVGVSDASAWWGCGASLATFAVLFRWG